ncbi:MAG: polyphosphate kinase 2, partial [Rothia mucilaginosa]
MAEQNPSTQPEEKAVEAPQTEAHQHAAGGAHAHTGSEKKQAIKEALKPQARRTSVV